MAESCQIPARTVLRRAIYTLLAAVAINAAALILGGVTVFGWSMYATLSIVSFWFLVEYGHYLKAGSLKVYLSEIAKQPSDLYDMVLFTQVLPILGAINGFIAIVLTAVGSLTLGLETPPNMHPWVLCATLSLWTIAVPNIIRWVKQIKVSDLSLPKLNFVERFLDKCEEDKDKKDTD